LPCPFYKIIKHHMSIIIKHIHLPILIILVYFPKPFYLFLSLNSKDVLTLYIYYGYNY
jgi:hypothetical protein